MYFIDMLHPIAWCDIERSLTKFIIFWPDIILFKDYLRHEQTFSVYFLLLEQMTRFIIQQI